jgi:hypothetical protein
MPNANTYTVAGISFYRGAWRLRTSNNLAERQKTLMAMGDTDINLIELPRPMNRLEIVQYLSVHPDFNLPEERLLLAQLKQRWHCAETGSVPAARPAEKTVQTKPRHTDPAWEPDF